MLLLRSASQVPSFLRPKLTRRVPVFHASQNIKLSEVPDICTSEEWNTTLREGRSTLQKHIDKYRTLEIEGNRNLATESRVIQRLQAFPSSAHLVNTFKYLLENSDETTNLLRWPGLITLMLSQAIGYPFADDNFYSKSLENAIWSSQVVLAEIVNILHYSLVFQKENFKVLSSIGQPDHARAMRQVNLLMQNYFMSSSINKFSALQKYKENFKVIYLLSDVIESMSKTKNNSRFDFNGITNKSFWEHKTFQSHGILLATGCQASLELAEHGEMVQRKAFEFGHLFTLAIQANADIQQFWNYQTGKTSSINLSGFPIALYLESNPEALAYIYTCGEDMSNLNTDQLNENIKHDLLLAEAKQHLEDYISRSLNILQEFESCDNAEILQYLIKLAKTLYFITEK